MNALTEGDPVLVKGQVWQMDDKFIRIHHVGRHLVEYRIMTVLQRRPGTLSPSISPIREVQRHLLTNHATLVEDCHSPEETVAPFVVRAKPFKRR